jgi:hypothetical protein
MLIKPALFILNIKSNLFTLFNLIKRLLTINYYSPLLNLNYKTVK